MQSLSNDDCDWGPHVFPHKTGTQSGKAQIDGAHPATLCIFVVSSHDLSKMASVGWPDFHGVQVSKGLCLKKQSRPKAESFL